MKLVVTTSGETTIRQLGALISAGPQIYDEAHLRSSVVACATLAESHTDRVITALFAKSGVNDHAVGFQLLQDAQESIFRSWETRKAWLARAFGVAISGERFCQNLGILTDLRNAIVHGDGRLTSLQCQRLAKMMELRRNMRRVMCVNIEGRQISLTSKTINCAARVTRDYLTGLDSAVLSQHPDFDV